MNMKLLLLDVLSRCIYLYYLAILSTQEMACLQNVGLTKTKDNFPLSYFTFCGKLVHLRIIGPLHFSDIVFYNLYEKIKLTA